MIEIGILDGTPTDKIIDILDSNQTVKAKYVINSDAVHNYDLMGDQYIEIKFVLSSNALFRRTDYILWQGIKYTLRNDYQPTEINSVNFEYTLRFESPAMLLQDAQMYYTRQDLKEGEWSLTSDAASFINIAAINANRYFNTNDWQIGTIEPVTTEFISFNSASVFDALTQIAEAFDAEWYITGTTINLVNKFQFGSEVEFENEVSVLSMSQSDGDAVSGFTRIVALGSTRNISPNYRETEGGEAVDAIYQKRLRIPISKGSTIDAWADMTPLEAVETTVIFDDVYPKRIGTMSGITTKEYTDTDTDTGVVTTWNAYRYKDTGLTFSKDYILQGVELRIVFQSGNLNGLDFAVKFNPEGLSETDPAAQVFEIVRNTDFGAALPNETLKPVNGDTYILYGFNIDLVADQYLPVAEQELYDKGLAWVENNLRDKSVYTCPTVIQHFYDNEMDLEIGQKVKLINSRFDGGFRSSRIMGFEKKLINKYDAVYTVGDNAAYTWRNDVDSNIQQLQYAGQVFQNSGGNSVYLIKQFDNTPPSEFNAYSAVASNARFLNRQTGGTVQGNVRVLGSTVSDVFGNDTFTSGQFGSGFKMWNAANGQSYAEIDNLLVRREMQVNTLTIAEIKSVGGQILVSVANMTVSGVSDQGTTYRCSFDTAEGTIPNYFALNDQVICRRWNGTNIKYYWALVTAIGLDYIDISKTDRDGTGTPAFGDEIIQFGNRTNTDRQSAIMISAYGSDAPSIKQYSGINSYDLTGKEKTVISPTGNKLTGSVTIEAGSQGYENIAGLPERFDGLLSGAVNLLRNTGFTGNFESKTLTPDTVLTPDTQMFSESLIYWEGEATVNADVNSQSGYSVTLLNQTISQPVSLIRDENYILSFRAKGSSVGVAVAGLTQSILLTSVYQRHVIKFAASAGNVFSIFGNCTVCEIQIERGTVPSDWTASPLDNDPTVERFQEIQYITDSVRNGKTTINGGLILSSQLQLGNFVNGQMREVTAGMSGIYNHAKDPSYWSGGTFRQAIVAANSPMSKIDTAHTVITHGGQIIANEAVIRGTIYAVDGEFSGEITAKSGTIGGFNIDEGKLTSQSLDTTGNPNILLDGENGIADITGRIQTNANGNRIIIDPADQSIKMKDSSDEILGQWLFYDTGEGGGNMGGFYLREVNTITKQTISRTTITGSSVRLSSGNDISSYNATIYPDSIIIKNNTGSEFQVSFNPSGKLIVKLTGIPNSSSGLDSDVIYVSSDRTLKLS